MWKELVLWISTQQKAKKAIPLPRPIVASPLQSLSLAAQRGVVAMPFAASSFSFSDNGSDWALFIT